MRLFLRVVVYLLVVIGVGVSSVTLFARSQPPAERIAILHLNSCKAPCWVGIEPGKTSVTDAEKQLREVFTNPYRITKSTLSGESETYFDVYLRGEPAFSVGLMHPEGDTVVTMSIYFGDDLSSKYRDYSLAELHNALGVPNYISINYVSSLVYSMPDGYVMIDGYDTDIDTPLMQRKARSITFFGMPVPLSANFGFFKWRGFLPIRQYSQNMCTPTC